MYMYMYMCMCVCVYIYILKIHKVINTVLREVKLNKALRSQKH